MDHIKLYHKIIDRAKCQKRQKDTGIYYESHHIIPKCLGGTGSVKQWKWHPNIVLLTAREHYICHWLLHEAYPENKSLILAFFQMCTTKNHKQQRYKPSSKIIEYIKIKNREARKNQVGFWNGKNLSEETKEKLRAANIGKKQSKETIEKRHKTKLKNDSYKKTAEKIRGRKDSEETKLKKRIKMIGFKHSEETKQRMRKSKAKKTCPHCGKEGGAGAMDQWHFNNCKRKNNEQ